MKAIDFSNSNNLLPTKNGNLPVFIGGSGEVISRWKFSWKEIFQLIRTRSVFILQYPQSVAFPQTEMTFRNLTPEELEEQEKQRKRQIVQANRDKRNPNRLIIPR